MIVGKPWRGNEVHKAGGEGGVTIQAAGIGRESRYNARSFLFDDP